MADDLFASSDSVRSGRVLKYAQSVTFGGPWALEIGGSLPEVTVAFETYGRLNAKRDNAVLVCHALSGDSPRRAARGRGRPRLVGLGRRIGKSNEYGPILCDLPECPGRMSRYDRPQQH